MSVRSGNSDKTCLLGPPTGCTSDEPTTSKLLLGVDEQRKGLMRRSTSSGAASLAGAFNNVRRSILRSVGGTSLNSASGSSPQRLPNCPRKSVSFHDLVRSSSVLHLALRSLSPKRQLTPSTSTLSAQNEGKKKSTQGESASLGRRSPSPLVNSASIEESRGSLKKSISNFVLTCEFY